MQEAIQFVTVGTAGFHLSFDMDAVDPGDAPGVGTPVAAASPIARRIWPWNWYATVVSWRPWKLWK